MGILGANFSNQLNPVMNNLYGLLDAARDGGLVSPANIKDAEEYAFIKG